MVRQQQKPGKDIAALIASGELDAQGALAAVQDQMGAMLTDEEPDEMQAEAAERQSKRDQEAQKSRIAALGFRLAALAKEQVALRQPMEERWLADIRQYNGVYDPGTFEDDTDGSQGYGSRLFVPLTRRLVNICEGRLADMCFVAGERGFTLKPTPVPELEQGLQLAEQLPPEHVLSGPDGPIPAGAYAASMKALTDEAGKKADAMQREIDDQLAECRYPIQARNIQHDAVLLGTGVLKGPFPLYKTSKKWTPGADGSSHSLVLKRRPVPITTRVDPWNFFPDMSATTIEDAEFAFERHFMTKKQLGAMKNMPDVDLDALRVVLGAEPIASPNNHREQLRAINGATGAPDKRYEVWEYHGPLTADDLADCGCEIENPDALDQYTGIVWFCEGQVLKAALNPLDTGVLPFRVFTWQKDESNIFGFGLPYEVRDNQVAANAAFRAGMDNMGLCAMPQVVIDDTKIRPVNGHWGIEPAKFWRNVEGKSAKDAIEFINIESRLGEFQNLFNTSKQLIEEVATLPAFLQGGDAPAAMQSATEASISWTAANIWVRRCIRNWDDDVVTPLISDYFDWNMQHSDKDEIKGDCQIQALGISSLVEMEGQAQKMQAFIGTAKAMGVPLSNQIQMLRQFARSYKLDPDLMLPTEQELAKMKQAEEKAPKVDPETRKLDVAQENNQLDARASAELIAFRQQELADRKEDRAAKQQIALATIASNERISVEDARQKYGFEAQKTSAVLADKQADRDLKGQLFNAESQLKVNQGSGI